MSEVKLRVIQPQRVPLPIAACIFPCVDALNVQRLHAPKLLRRFGRCAHPFKAHHLHVGQIANYLRELRDVTKMGKVNEVMARVCLGERPQEVEMRKVVSKPQRAVSEVVHRVHSRKMNSVSGVRFKWSMIAAPMTSRPIPKNGMSTTPTAMVKPSRIVIFLGASSRTPLGPSLVMRHPLSNKS